MLNFQKLVGQIESVGVDNADTLASLQETLAAAHLAYSEAAAEPSSLANRLAENIDRALWPLAQPLEPFGQKYPLASAPTEVPRHTVVAVDGSQIMPSQHEVHNCFLLNIGIVRLSYGVQAQPLLESVPHLYHRQEELYPLVNRRRMHIDELYVSLERNLLELDSLFKSALEAKVLGLQVVALTDGSLIPWSAEKMPETYKQHYFSRVNSALAAFEAEQIPVIGYLSHSRGTDIVNALRVHRCPYEFTDCRSQCNHLNEEDFPCSSIWPLLDRLLLQKLLPIWHRSSIFASGASALKSLEGNQRICFCYLNVNQEIARLEFPRWLTNNRSIFDIALGAICGQVNKGRGYPVALAEAHHLAVIRGQDRLQFFELLTQHLVAQGLKQVKLSPKESKKRIGHV